MAAQTYKVKLNTDELSMATLVGIRRRIESLHAGRKNNHGYSGDDAWFIDIEGACAELALAKFLGLFWDGSVNTFKRPDVGSIQVRHTKYRDGCLIVRNPDADDEIHVLVRGEAPNYEIVGWISGKDARKRGKLRAPSGRPPAYFVDQENLEQFKRRDYE